MNFGAYDYAKKDLNELPLRRRTLYPTEVLGHTYEIDSVGITSSKF